MHLLFIKQWNLSTVSSWNTTKLTKVVLSASLLPTQGRILTLSTQANYRNRYQNPSTYRQICRQSITFTIYNLLYIVKIVIGLWVWEKGIILDRIAYHTRKENHFDGILSVFFIFDCSHNTDLPCRF